MVVSYMNEMLWIGVLISGGAFFGHSEPWSWCDTGRNEVKTSMMKFGILYVAMLIDIIYITSIWRKQHKKSTNNSFHHWKQKREKNTNSWILNTM